jgi:hypothetical protein
MIEPAVASYGPTHTKADVWRMIEAGDAQLWTDRDCAMVTEIKVWPTGYKEAVAWLAGGNLDGVRRLTPIIEDWARDKGCDRAAVIAGRRGWVRELTDYRASGSFLTKDL